jgi:hypothetical protein
MCGNPVGIAVLLAEFWTWQIWNTKHDFYPIDRFVLLALVRLFAQWNQGRSSGRTRKAIVVLRRLLPVLHTVL